MNQGRLAKAESDLNDAHRIFKWAEQFRLATVPDAYLTAQFEGSGDDPVSGLIGWSGEKLADAVSDDDRRSRLKDDSDYRASRTIFAMNSVIELNSEAGQVIEESAGKVEAARRILALLDKFSTPRADEHEKPQAHQPVREPNRRSSKPHLDDIAENLAFCADSLRQVLVDVGSIELAARSVSDRRFEGRKLLNRSIARGLRIRRLDACRLVALHNVLIERFKSRVRTPRRYLAKIDLDKLEHLTDERGAAIVLTLEAFIHARTQLSFGEIEGAKKAASPYLRNTK